jgi:A/G-specific adenine glycosylase
MFPSDVVHEVQAGLLAFYDARGRDLPWRYTRDPYAIWISEIMAQQTRVDTVIPYYDRWLRRFPDVHALASADVDDVLKEWEGLGYYSRARNLHSAARVVCDRHAGVLPDSYAALRELPGVGDYTAGAVASIAYGASEPAVDGNVRRVLCRLLDVPDLSPAKLRSAAAGLVPAERPGEFNQALMELGSTVCTPRAPRCHDCPLAAHCRARAAGTQLQRPRAKPKKQIPTIDVAVAILRRSGDHVLLQRRPDGGLLGGMWAFPAREVNEGADPEDTAHALARDVTGRTPHLVRHAGDVPHVFSHRREVYHCYLFAVADDVETSGEWVGRGPIRHALPRAHQKIRALAFA